MDISILVWTALSIGFVHTIIGPDHYLPFIVMAKAKNWSQYRTFIITLIAGVGHVLGSVALGVVGIIIGGALNLMESIEAYRGDLASWLLIGFGIAYGVWGLRIGLRSVEHSHDHEHDGDSHHHKHHHLGRHRHLHGNEKSITPWALFVIFVLGPCEPLIPILMYPAAQGSWIDVLYVSLAFGGATIVTMLGMVWLVSLGVMKIKLNFLEKYVHALAGFIIAFSGLSIKIFGL
jgi:sulfite exporter TauE/SafE